jgi:branched-chain amino acid transport system substrate-binding protein
MSFRHLTLAVALVGALPAATSAAADEPVKLGLILPMTGPFFATGRQLNDAVQLYLQQHGTQVAGRTVEIIVKDDAAIPANTKRLAQELIVNDKVAAIAGFAVTPGALVAAPLATQVRIPEIVMVAAGSTVTEKSPYIVRTSFTMAQSSTVMAKWAARNGIRKVVTIVSDYSPGVESETSFKRSFTEAGGEVVEAIRVPFPSPDFAPFLQRARDAGPEALFVFIPVEQVQFVKQFAERGLDKAGIRLLCTGDVVDDEKLNGMGDVMLGTISAHDYSAAHPSAMNAGYVAAFKQANQGLRPNHNSVSGYDGMHLFYEALRKTNGSADGDALSRP